MKLLVGLRNHRRDSGLEQFRSQHQQGRDGLDDGFGKVARGEQALLQLESIFEFHPFTAAALMQTGLWVRWLCLSDFHS